MVFEWSQFYEKQGRRGVRPTFESALAAWGAAPGRAIDLGCGDGGETRALAERGWRVLAVDADPGVDERVRAGLSVEARGRVQTQSAMFESLNDLPRVDLVYAGFALPFCDPERFAAFGRTSVMRLSQGACSQANYSARAMHGSVGRG